MVSPVLISFNGETLSYSGWGRKLRLSPGTIYRRLKIGQPLEKALSPERCPRGMGTLKHGHARKCGSSTEYRSWRAMRSRCENPNNPDWKLYGGRGIKVCERWSSFAAFLEDMGPKPARCSIDRIKNDLGYMPGNCRWATSLEQSHNQRRRQKCS